MYQLIVADSLTQSIDHLCIENSVDQILSVVVGGIQFIVLMSKEKGYFSIVQLISCERPQRPQS